MLLLHHCGILLLTTEALLPEAGLHTMIAYNHVYVLITLLAYSACILSAVARRLRFDSDALRITTAVVSSKQSLLLTSSSTMLHTGAVIIAELLLLFQLPPVTECHCVWRRTRRIECQEGRVAL